MLGMNSKTNAERLKEQVDSLDIEPYGTVKDMMDNVSQRNLSFERIVISTASLRDKKTMEALHRFLREIHPRAQVVLLFQDKNGGKQLAKTFGEVFDSPLYTDVELTGSHNINLLVELATESVDLLREKYSVNKYTSNGDGIIQDKYTTGTSEVKSGVLDRDALFSTPMLVLPQKKKQKKRTGLFGVRKLTKAESEMNNVNLKLVYDYMQFVLRSKNTVSDQSKPSIPKEHRMSMSNPTESAPISSNAKHNMTRAFDDDYQKPIDFIPNPAFSQWELGHYGFSAQYEGKPMLFRLGVRVNQVHQSK